MPTKFNLQLTPNLYETLLLTDLFNAFALPFFDGQGIALWLEAQCDPNDHRRPRLWPNRQARQSMDQDP